MALLILALLQRIFLMSSLMLLLVWLIFFMVLIKLLPILGTISGKTVKLMVLALICLGNNRQDRHPPNCMFSCLQILEAFLWFVLITLLNVTLIILTLSVSRLLNLLLRLVAFLLFLNPQCLASISRWITASSSWKRFCLFVCRALRDRKSGSAGMPRPISYAVFCLKKKKIIINTTLGSKQHTPNITKIVTQSIGIIINRL